MLFEGNTLKALIQRLVGEFITRIEPALGARVYADANVTLTTATLTTLAFNQERWDDGNCHDNATNNTRLTAPADGWYVISASIRFAQNSTGSRSVTFRVNGLGSLYIASQAQPACSDCVTDVALTTVYYLAAGDYVECQATQYSGGNLDVVYGARYSPEFSMVRVP